MTNEPKDVRLPVMVSATEASAIDDFRFANRISTRAEAIRQLIQTGLDLPLLCINLLDAIEAEGYLDTGDMKEPVAALDAYLGTSRSGDFEQK